MKNLIFILLTFCGSLAFALPDGGVVCENDIDVVGDAHMSVVVKDGTLDFTFWESGFGPIKATTYGTNVFTLVEEKVEFSGEGETWLEVYSAFLVYNPAQNSMSVSLDSGYGVSERVLTCKPAQVSVTI